MCHLNFNFQLNGGHQPAIVQLHHHSFCFCQFKRTQAGNEQLYTGDVKALGRVTYQYLWLSLPFLPHTSIPFPDNGRKDDKKCEGFSLFMPLAAWPLGINSFMVLSITPVLTVSRSLWSYHAYCSFSKRQCMHRPKQLCSHSLQPFVHISKVVKTI